MAALLSTWVLVTVALYWRRPDAFTSPQLWAEDGPVFLQGAQDYGVHAILEPYSGYYHLAARLTAFAGDALPVVARPGWYSAAAWVFALLVVAYVHSERFRFTRGQRLLMSLALVCTTADNEVFFNLANFATMSALPLVLVVASGEPRRSVQAAIDIALLVVFGLSTPFIVGLWVLFLVRAGWRRTRHSAALAMLAGCVALVQSSHMLARLGAPRATGGTVLLDALVMQVLHVFVGDVALHFDPNPVWRVLSALGIASGLAGLAFVALRSERRAGLYFLAASCIGLAISLTVLRTWPEAAVATHVGRHHYLFAVTLLWALSSVTLPRHFERALLGLCALAFAFMTPGTKNVRLHDLDWATEVANCSFRQSPCVVPINPKGDPQTWFVELRVPRP